jgi:ribosome-associated toxin RatA of RatAB toxin-antitoxin module
MMSVKRTRVVPYTCAQMYALVDGIEQYADFVPHLTSATVHYRTEDEVQATLALSVAGMQKSFTTHNRLQNNKMIEIRLVDGPFSHLEGFWRFDEVPEGCLMSFDLEFSFSAGFLSKLIEPIFSQMTETLADAFYKRAVELYGPG